MFQTYQDRLDYWYPAIRFRKEDGVISPIRAKEQGDWKSLSLDDKKLRRFSFLNSSQRFVFRLMKLFSFRS